MRTEDEFFIYKTKVFKDYVNFIFFNVWGFKNRKILEILFY